MCQKQSRRATHDALKLAVQEKACEWNGKMKSGVLKMLKASEAGHVRVADQVAIEELEEK